MKAVSVMLWECTTDKCGSRLIRSARRAAPAVSEVKA